MPIQRILESYAMDALTFATAFGPCSLSWAEAGVRAFRFRASSKADGRLPDAAPVWVFEAVRRITDHLAGRPADLTAIPLDLSVLTPFQAGVAEVLRGTRPGEVLSYGDVALRMGRPGAARAVGYAVKTNPVLLLIPCHRVVARESEGGFSAFGSMDLKQRLRALEAGHTGGDAAAPPR
jgi:methylated-DNA-[protein]-cysteine S-methyltransferase